MSVRQALRVSLLRVATPQVCPATPLATLCSPLIPPTAFCSCALAPRASLLPAQRADNARFVASHIKAAPFTALTLQPRSAVADEAADEWLSAPGQQLAVMQASLQDMTAEAWDRAYLVQVRNS